MLNLPADVSFEPRATYRPVKSGTYVCHRSARKSERSSNRRYEVAADRANCSGTRRA